MTVGFDELSEQVRATRTSSAGWHIQRLAGQLDRAMNRALEPHGLTVQSFAIVMALVEQDGLSQTQIGERFSAPAYAISRAIDSLERDGYLERRTDPRSRRSNTVHATGKAKALIPTLLTIIDGVNGGLMARLSSAERSQMIALLSKVLADNSLADV
ncbi:MAG: MarR family transcriptional regulator [Rhizobiales bacterium]|nr:MarR family transcriptional regulator [Hyphomicrobiales bacterium]MBO6697299.1 MarR family transcriptional regulator [Hyphomicrobiales bacterium]MBO6736446.1 MarR family transcriptional regulator [Hyphomicrobiales bacterium]MBO6912916.1 MarR family transcriptional regulator [Hyphomicrobiales bacterium]MBO6954084.1 MarR family transcriptional regulator [Hyphomicrobiales bacterium]